MNPDNYQIKTALISVSDKTGLVEFAKGLAELGIEIYSTGGTQRVIAESGISVKSVSELTNFPEILDGRVKTLHPFVHAGLLANFDNEKHIEQLQHYNIKSIDILVVNLYPFEETLNNKESTDDEIIENIDIGGPTMLRAAAKNYKWTLPIINPQRYSEVISLLRNNKCTISEYYRKELAAEVFANTAYYDSVISGYFSGNKIDSVITALPLKLEYKLRYGENPHQRATLYGNFGNVYKKLHGKELSYNNILDIDSASKLIIEFDETICAIIKHTNPCGVAISDNPGRAFEIAFETDTVSPYGGIFAFNSEIDEEAANKIHSIFSEVIIAPSYTVEALTLLSKKKERRLIQVDLAQMKSCLSFDLRAVSGGFLLQETDTKLLDDSGYKIVSKRHPTPDELQSLLFGWKVVKHVKSNAIVYTKKDRTLAIGTGQMSRLDSSRIAVEKAKIMNLDLKGSTVASDAFFPFADGLIQAVEAGATAVIQPGGSIRDEEVIKVADDNNIAMVFTGIRHFRH